MMRNIQLISSLLYSLEVDVSFATSGQDALRAVEHAPPDLILLDVNMPQMNGFELCDRLKAEPRHRDIPVIFLTAQAQKQDLVRGFELGAADYVTKPFHAPELLSRVKTHLELARKREELKRLNQSLAQKVEHKTQELRQRNAELAEANAKLAVLDHAKNDFLLLLNHEMRTPLNTILSLAETLEVRLKETLKKDSLKPIYSAVERLGRMSEMAMLLTSLKAEGYRRHDSPFNLRSLAQVAYQSLAGEYAGKEIALRESFPEGPIDLHSDEQLAYQCLRIVLGNAFKFSPKGGSVELSASLKDRMAVVWVRDSGPGFSPKVMANLFDYFLTERIDHHSQGFGLGLATAHLIMKTLQGKIQLDNPPGGGAQVRLCFPLAPPAAGQAPENP